MTFNFITKLAQDERGATLIEYGIAIVLAVLVGTAGLLTLGGQVNENMDTAANGMAVPDAN